MTSTFLPRERERDREVAGGERLSCPTLRAEHAHEPPVLPVSNRGAVARGAGDSLAHREPELLLRLREERHVRGAGVERPAQEPVRGGRREHDDRQIGRLPVGSVDDLQRAVVLAALTGDEEYVDVSAPQGLDQLVDAVGDPDQLEARVVGHGPLHVEGVEPLDGNERADERIGHGRSTSLPGCGLPGPATSPS